jgi:endonuclease YncB( thermonuclease family)
MIMRRWLLGLALALMAACSSSSGEGWTGKVERVVDGDTLVVSRGEKLVTIRLWGVDAPERAQEWGKAAKRFTTKWVGLQVRVRERDHDRYNRLVAEVWAKDRCLNHELLKAGLGWWYRSLAKSCRPCAEAEEEARRKRRGLWSDPHPLAPWTWRAEHPRGSH